MAPDPLVPKSPLPFWHPQMVPAVPWYQHQPSELLGDPKPVGFLGSPPAMGTAREAAEPS